MEVIYKREQGHNYILFPGKGKTGIQTEMIRRNKIPGLAGFYTEWEDNQMYYGYDITGAKPLGQMLEVRTFTRKEMEGFLRELAEVFRQMESFLLDKDKLVLKPELLYVYADSQGHVRLDMQGFLFFFCEEQEGSCQEHLRELLLYLFERTDEEDRKLTELLFRLYRSLACGEPETEELLACLDLCPSAEEKKEKSSAYAAEGHLEALYGSGIQTEAEVTGKKGKTRKGMFGGKRESLARLFGRGPVPLEEMWDDLEPERVADRKLEQPERMERKSADMEEKERRGAADHPTEILYVMEETGDTASLTAEAGEEKIWLNHFPFYIGTQPGMDYCPDFHGISRIHLKLEQRGNDIWIKDLNSTNGTCLNGENLKPNEERKLKDKDRIRLAGLVYEFDSGGRS